MKVIVPLAIVILTTIGCGKSEEQRQADALAAQAQQGADNVAKNADAAAKGMADLASGLGAAFGGDPNAKPVPPVSFRDLQALLPEPSGWQREKPTGERMTAPVNFAEASVRMMKGDATVTVKITDSALNQILVAPFAMFLAGNYERETDRGYEKSIKIGDIPGFEKWDSETKSGDLTVIVNKRFIVEVDGSTIEGPNVLHEILGKTDLKKLAELK